MQVPHIHRACAVDEGKYDLLVRTATTGHLFVAHILQRLQQVVTALYTHDTLVKPAPENQLPARTALVCGDMVFVVFWNRCELKPRSCEHEAVKRGVSLRMEEATPVSAEKFQAIAERQHSPWNGPRLLYCPSFFPTKRLAPQGGCYVHEI